jgi:hypothetical protein
MLMTPSSEYKLHDGISQRTIIAINSKTFQVIRRFAETDEKTETSFRFTG